MLPLVVEETEAGSRGTDRWPGQSQSPPTRRPLRVKVWLGCTEPEQAGIKNGILIVLHEIKFQFRLVCSLSSSGEPGEVSVCAREGEQHGHPAAALRGQQPGLAASHL